MELVLEVIIYLLVVLGLITVCFTFFSKFNFLGPVVANEIIEDEKEIQKDNTYCRVKNNNQKITMNIRYKNISVEELNRIKESIEVGNYANIADIVDEINYIESVQNKGKAKRAKKQ